MSDVHDCPICNEDSEWCDCGYEGEYTECYSCGGEMEWCSSCRTYTQICCVDYGTCMCS